MKRILILAALAAFAVAGCSREDPKPTSTPTPEVTPPAGTTQAPAAPSDAKK
jgi:PBP1b-binding outer membrane lipoprotein LpoB